jgi:hypothetical protein
MPYSLDHSAKSWQDDLRAEVQEKRARYELAKTIEARAEYLLALKKLSDMACWRIGG